jgi:heme/copper-type cytochrome/quinol oxidase subunit 3
MRDLTGDPWNGRTLEWSTRLAAAGRSVAPARGGGFGFWLFLLSDILIFAALFAAYAVLSGETAGGPTGAMLFDKRNVFIETACLLASSVTCGFGSLAMQRADCAPPGSGWR